jgi:hypothetical protein
VDQVIVSGSGAAVSIQGATLLPTADFGRLATALAGFYLLLAPLRAVVGEVYVVRFAHASPHVPAGFAGQAQAAAARMSLLAAAALGGGAAVGVRDPASRGVVVALAVAAPALLLQDVRRAILVAAARTRRSATASAIVLVGQLAGGAVLEASGSVSAPALLLVWGGSAAASALAVRVSADRVRGNGGVRRWLAGGVQYWPRFLVEALAQSAASQLPLLLVAGIAGASVNAGIRAAALLVAPLTVLQQAVAQLVVAESARLPRAGLRSFAARGQLALLLASGGWLSAVTLIPGSLLTHVVGGNLSAARAALPGIAVFVAGSLLVVPPAAVLRTTGNVRTAMMIRLALAPLLVVLPVVLAVGARTAGPVAAGFGAFGVCSVLVWTVAGRTVLRRDKSEPSVRPARSAIHSGPDRTGPRRPGAAPSGRAGLFVEVGPRGTPPGREGTSG